MIRSCVMAFVVVGLGTGCLLAPGGGGRGGGSGGGGGNMPSPVTTWPTFSGDCVAGWDHTITAQNSNAYANPDPLIGFTLKDAVPGEQGFRAYLSMDFNPADVGSALNVDKSAAGKTLDLTFIIDEGDTGTKSSTTYSQFDNGVTGGVHGTVTVSAYDPGAGTAEFSFSNATLIGEDQLYAGNFRCGINGTLKISGFDHTATGTECQSDLECGGGYSGKVCDNNTFKCVSGCHVAEDCAVGKTCDTGSSTCS